MIIPGQSLTAEPKNAPYENPPQYSTPEDALEFHLDRLTQKDKMDAIVDALELGLDVVTLTEGILRGAVLDGRHSVDISLLISPIIHEFIKTTADKSGIEYDEGFPDESAEEEKVRRAITDRKAKRIIEEHKKTGDVKTPIEEDMEDDIEDAEVLEETPAEAPKGLMARMSKLEGDM